MIVIITKDEIEKTFNIPDKRFLYFNLDFKVWCVVYRTEIIQFVNIEEALKFIRAQNLRKEIQ